MDDMVQRVARGPLIISVCHSKGGVGKTTTTLVIGKFLARQYRVALRDYDDTKQLTDLVQSLNVVDGHITRRLWLDPGRSGVSTHLQEPDMVLIDAEPARGPRTWQALREADYVLIPAPPEGLAVRAMRQMLETVELAAAQGNPALQILGVVPTMFDRRWPEHHAFLEEMEHECRQARIRLFPPVARRQSYLYLSTQGQDYRPVAEAIQAALIEHQRHLSVGVRRSA